MTLQPRVAVRWQPIADDDTRVAVRQLAVLLATSDQSMVTAVTFAATPVSVLTASSVPVGGVVALSLAFATQSANKLFAGPASGTAAVPAFRTVAASEVGALSALTLQVKNTFPAGPVTGANAAPTWRVLDKADLPAETARLDIANALNGDQTATGGNFIAATAGKGMRIKEGSNARSGQSVLVAGTVTVANTSITANSRVQLTRAIGGGTRGLLEVGTVVNGTSFVINSVDSTGTPVADTSTINWLIVEAL